MQLPRLFSAEDRAHLVTLDFLGKGDKAARLDEAEAKVWQVAGLALLLGFLLGAACAAVIA